MKRIVGSLVLLAVFVGAARAHFVFLLPKADGSVSAVFSDNLEPDREELLEKIKHATFAVQAGDKMAKLKATKDGDVLKITGAGKGPAWVHGVCPYGVVEKGKEPFLLTYYARSLINDTMPRTLITRHTTPSITTMKLDLLIKPQKDAAFVQVLWNGKPVSGAEVVAYVPGKKGTSKMETDAMGLARLGPATENGTYALRARHVVKKKGELKGKKYSEERAYATMTFLVSDLRKVSADVSKRPAEDAEATKLLADARAARASWSGMPGFSADVTVNNEGRSSSGKMSVDAKGKVTLKLDGDDAPWARAMLSSVVGHRMDDASTLTTPCAFPDDVTDHPLGRAIRVLNDEHHSSYRIRDRQVIVVNRTAGPVRFTITVLENRQNAEKKYLPASYVVNTWDKKTDALSRSVTHHNTWVRVGSYDLPDVLTIVTAEAGKQTTRTIRLSGHKLATKAE